MERRKKEPIIDNSYSDFFDDKTVENLKEIHIKTRKEFFSLSESWNKIVDDLTTYFDLLFRFILNNSQNSKINHEALKIVELIEKNVKKILWDIDENNINIKNKFLEIEKVVIEEFKRLWWEIHNSKFCRLTNLWNSNSFYEQINRIFSEKKDFTLLLFDLNELKYINDTYWHWNWDTLLKDFWKWLINTNIFWNETSEVYRIWWDEFAVIYFWDPELLKDKIRLLRKYFFNNNSDIIKLWKFETKHEITFWVWEQRTDYENINDFQKLKELADNKLYLEKKLEKIRTYIKKHKITEKIFKILEVNLINAKQETIDFVYKKIFNWLSKIISEKILNKYNEIENNILKSWKYRGEIKNIDEIKKNIEPRVIKQIEKYIDNILEKNINLICKKIENLCKIKTTEK